MTIDPQIIVEDILEEIEHHTIDSYKIFGRAIKIKNDAKKKFTRAIFSGEYT
jgi:hypothetical protein